MSLRPVALAGALLALAAAPGFPPAAAAHDLLAVGGAGPGGWVALEIESGEGAEYVFIVWTGGGWTKAAMGAAAYDVDGNVLVSSVTAGEHPGSGFSATVGPVSAGDFVRPASHPHASNGIGVARSGPGVMRIVGWVASDGEWSWDLEGHGDVTVRALAEGDRTLLATSEDFSRLAGARAGVPLWPFCLGLVCNPGVRADAGGRVEFEVEHELRGFYTKGIGGPDVMTAEGPEGTTVCPCFFERDHALDVDAATGRFSWAPGEYAFGLSGAATTGAFPGGEVFLALADVEVPW